MQQVVAHVLCVAQRYQSLIDTRDFRRAREPSELDQINKEEMEAQMAPIPDLIAQLEALETVMDSGSTVYPTTSPKSSTAVQSFLGRSHRSTGSAS